MYKIPAKTLFIGRNLIYLPECHSTNDAMLLLCQKETPAEGTLIITREQTSGRGQRGNKWESEPGTNLTFTVLVRPSFLPLNRQFYLNIFVSLAIRDYLTEKGLKKVQIKWPNDILIEGKKIAGILIENQLTGSTMSASAIGIGLNINQQQFSIQSATSVVSQTRINSDLQLEFESVVKSLEVRYLQLRSASYASLLEEYLASLFALNQPFRFVDKTGEFTGIIRGIDVSGRLLIEKPGSIESYDLKEISYVGNVDGETGF